MSIQSNIVDAPMDLALRRAFSSFPTGVVAVCGTAADGSRVGMAVNSFTSISLDPPLVAISVARSSRTWPALASAGSIGLSVLGDGQEQTSRGLSAREGDRFEGVTLAEQEGGAVNIEGAALWLTTRVHAEVDGGDHVIVLLAIDGLKHFPEVEPLVFHQSRYRAIGA